MLQGASTARARGPRRTSSRAPRPRPPDGVRFADDADAEARGRASKASEAGASRARRRPGGTARRRRRSRTRRRSSRSKSDVLDSGTMIRVNRRKRSADRPWTEGHAPLGLDVAIADAMIICAIPKPANSPAQRRRSSASTFARHSSARVSRRGRSRSGGDVGPGASAAATRRSAEAVTMHTTTARAPRASKTYRSQPPSGIFCERRHDGRARECVVAAGLRPPSLACESRDAPSGRRLALGRARESRSDIAKGTHAAPGTARFGWTGSDWQPILPHIAGNQQ